MNWEKHYKLCSKIAKEAHEGQKRKISGKEYFIHPKQVAQQFINIDDWFSACVAILHDVIEDTKETVISLIQKNVDIEVVRLVIRLSKNLSNSYTDYLENIIKEDVCCKVKIVDIKNNMKDIPKEWKEWKQLKEKYEASLLYLQSKTTI